MLQRAIDLNRARARFATHVLGPHFEEIAREFTFRFAAAETVGGRLASVGPAVVNDPGGRAQHELDIVGLGRRPDGAAAVLCLGEATHTTSKRTTSDLARLERIRSLVAAKEPSAATARLLLFSAAGFERNLVRECAPRRDVELVDIGRIYRGE